MQIPFAMFTVALGGITPTQVIAVYVAMCLHLLFVSSIGLWVSVHCHTSAGAVVLATMMLGQWCFGASSLQPILILIGDFLGLSNGLMFFLTDQLGLFQTISGFSRVAELLQPTNSQPHWWDWRDTLQFGVALTAILWAWASLRFQTAIEAQARRQQSARRIRRLRPWKNAVVWKEFMFVAGGWRGMVIRVVLYPLVGFIVVHGWKLDRMYEPAIRMLGWDGAMLLAQVISREFRDGTWDTLRLVPMTLRKLYYAKLAAVALALIPGVLWVMVTQPYWRFYFGAMEPVFYGTLVLFGWHISALASILLYRASWSIAFFIGVVSATVEYQLVERIILRSLFPFDTLITFSQLNLIACVILSQLIRIRIRNLSE